LQRPARPLQKLHIRELIDFRRTDLRRQFPYTASAYFDPPQGNAMASTLQADSLIESALFARSRTSQPVANGHQQAMAKRLAQLQTAMGANDADATAAAPAPSTQPAATPGIGLSACLLTSLISAALGATAMWLLLPGHSPSMAPMAAENNARFSVAAPAAIAPQAATPPAAAAPSASLPKDESLVEQRIEDWRQAWGKHDVAGYLGAYSESFTPADGGSRADWVVARSKKVGSKAAIEVAINDLALERQGPDRFKVSFRQDYASGSYREVGRSKTLLLAHEEGGWKIVREQQD
jgi:ketosteroid isomerase-like protein